MKKVSVLFVIILLLTSCQQVKTPKYIFYFVGDGMGVNQVLGTQMYKAEKKRRIGTEYLSFSEFPIATFVATYSRYNAVTCSAAAGTALATGTKTKKGAIGMDSLLQHPLRSIAYQAKEKGYSVGILTTTSIDHATPASFYAHQPSRYLGYEIACETVTSGFDFFAGAGFSECEKNNQPNVVSLLNEAGYFVARGLEEYSNRPDSTDHIILLQNDSLERLPYAIDRKPDDLELKQLTRAAIDFFSKNEKGFFVMVEGGLIDWACHSNDAATVFSEIDDFSQAVRVALEFYHDHPDETLIVVTADHETGGLVLGIGESYLNLAKLQYQKCSVDKLTERIIALYNGKNTLAWNEMKLFLQANLGFWKEVEITQEEEQYLYSIFRQIVPQTVKNLYSENTRLAQEAIKILNKKAKVGWTSSYHSAGVVPVYAIGCGADNFMQVRDNTDIPRLISKLME